MDDTSGGERTLPEGCQPEIRSATTTEFHLINANKKANFIYGELLADGVLVFVIENLPKTQPPTGCAGKWMFAQMMDHFGTSVLAIQGSWGSAISDNLAAVNSLTAAGASLEEAAKQSWTGTRARSHGFTKVEVIGTPAGQPGVYTDVRVRFKKEGD